MSTPPEENKQPKGDFPSTGNTSKSIDEAPRELELPLGICNLITEVSQQFVQNAEVHRCENCAKCLFSRTRLLDLLSRLGENNNVTPEKLNSTPCEPGVHLCAVCANNFISKAPRELDLLSKFGGNMDVALEKLKSQGMPAKMHRCKTCGECFPSGPALGGHQSKHNKRNVKRRGKESLDSQSSNFQQKVDPVDGQSSNVQNREPLHRNYDMNELPHERREGETSSKGKKLKEKQKEEEEEDKERSNDFRCKKSR